VYGNSFKSVLVAVVVPKEDAIKGWAAANGKSGERNAHSAAGQIVSHLMGLACCVCGGSNI
jgi:long-subunit acyl-CoA synthetase (AMP-forming)